MDIYSQIAVRIIKSQESIIGPVAIEQAQRVPHLNVNWDKKEVNIDGKDETKVIDSLIQIYKELFGEISVQVSKEAAASLIGQLEENKLPTSLR